MMENNKNQEIDKQKQENWTGIHEDFGEIRGSYTRQWYWEKEGLTYQDAQEWIKAGFKLKDYEKVKSWKEAGFTSQRTKQLMEIGFLKSDWEYAKQWENLDFSSEKIESWIKKGLNSHELKIASRLKQNNIQSLQLTKLLQLKKEFYPDYPQAKGYLDKNYPCDCSEKDKDNKLIHQKNCSRKNLWAINLRNLNLEGGLDLEEFPDCSEIYLAGNLRLGEVKNKPFRTKLIYQNPTEWLNLKYSNKNQVETIDLADFEQPSELIIDGYSNLKEINGRIVSNLTKLTIKNCRQLKKIDVYNFENLQQLILNNLPNLRELKCPEESKLTTLDLTEFTNLQSIVWSNQLTKIKLPPTAKEKLGYLSLYNNNFPKQDLSFLKDFVGLNSLWLGNNKFYGSLEPLKDLKKLKVLEIRDTDIDSGLEHLPGSLENFYCLVARRKDAKVKAIWDLFVDKTNEYEIKKFPQKLQGYKQWRKSNFMEEEIKQLVSAGFTLQNWKNELTKWESKGFNEEQIKEWTKAGARANDYEFVKWLKKTKKETSQWITNYKEDYRVLSERFKKYGLCSECNQPSTGEQWCKDCSSKRLEKNLPEKLNKLGELILKYQLGATDKDKFLEWISYEQFTDIKYLAKGGFSKVYKAKWTEGNVSHWDTENKQWKRKKDYYFDEEGKNQRDFEWNKDKYKKHKNYREVILKSLNNSSENTDFLQEVAKHKDIDDWFNNIVPCYGLSQEPQTGNYLMVMKYMPEGNLRHYLSNKNQELTLKDKISYLVRIAQGLKDLHQKNLVHRDFHSGNILKGIEKVSCLITDLGLCKPVDEAKQEDKIFGVMPYVAPEVLRSQPYTQASDIYSFGIVAYEVLSGSPPYYDKEHNVVLGMQICQGQRPKFQIKIPQLLENLIEKCWDADPAKRPTASELERTLRKWQEEINDLRNTTEFKKQLQEAEEYNKTLPKEIKSPDYKNKVHSGAIYTSRLLPTSEITQYYTAKSTLQIKIQELSEQLKKIKSLPEETNKESSQENKDLDLFLDKSEKLSRGLEKMISVDQKTDISKNQQITEEMIDLFGDLKKQLGIKIEQKEEKLKNLKNTVIIKNKLDKDAQSDLNLLLKNKKEATEKNDEESIRQLEKSKGELKSFGVDEKEIENLCQLQAEVTQLELTLGISRQINHIINHFSGTFHASVFGGNVTTGNNSNFGTIGVQNLGNVNTQHNNLGEAKIQQNNLPIPPN